MTPSRIRELRGDLGMTQVELARHLGVHPISVSRWETGQRSPSHFVCDALLRSVKAHAGWEAPIAAAKSA